MLATFPKARLLLLRKRPALLFLQLGNGIVGLILPLVAETFVEHQREDVVLVILPGRLATQDIRRAPQVGFELVERELHACLIPTYIGPLSHLAIVVDKSRPI